MSIRSNIVFADNTADLKARIASTSTEIFAMKDAVERTSRALGGDGLLKAAHQTTAAVEQLGGATKLTTAEKERINKQLTTAIEKYQALGRTAPPAMIELANATKQTVAPTESLASQATKIAAGWLAAKFMFDAVKASLAFADKIDDLSRATGISVHELQR